VQSALQSWVVILPLSQVLLGCRGEPNACYGVELGAQYDIELIEIYDENSSFLGAGYNAGCGPDFDIEAGDKVRVEVQGQKAHPANDCLGSIVTVVDPASHGWDILKLRNENKFPRQVFLGQFEASIQGCEGLLQIYVDVRRTPPSLFSVSEPGKEPYFIFDRTFVTSSCPATEENGCDDQYVATIHEVETTP